MTHRRLQVPETNYHEGLGMLVLALCTCLVLADSRPTPPSARSKSAPAARPGDTIPPALKPFVKYGMGGFIVCWFIGGLVWITRAKWRRARTEAERRAVKRWVVGLVLGIACSLGLIAAGLVLNARYRLPYAALWCLWLASPLALFLPPWLAARVGRVRDGTGSTKPAP
jgi:hypothetical protein